MATRTFTDEELEGLRGFPEIGREELFRFFTLTPGRFMAFVDPGRGRGPADRLGLAVAVCTLPHIRPNFGGYYGDPKTQQPRGVVRGTGPQDVGQRLRVCGVPTAASGAAGLAWWPGLM